MIEAHVPDLQRDRPESPFGKLLSRFLHVHAAALCAVFVDHDGECIDYATRVDPFEAQVGAAQLMLLSSQLSPCLRRTGAGGLILWVLETEKRDFVVRRVTDEHAVVVALVAGGVSARVLRAMAALAEVLRREGGLAVAAWDPWGEPFEVTVRTSPGFGYAPAMLSAADGAPREVEVLGRWHEGGSISSQEVVCFRVRCGPDEFTLVHDPALDRWVRR